MDLRDYLAAIRRRFYVFIPVMLVIVGAHVVWVTYGQKLSYEASSHIAVKQATKERAQLGTLTPSAWVRQPTPSAIKQAIEEQGVRSSITELLSGKREFSLREFTRPPLEGEVASSVAAFQESAASEDLAVALAGNLSVDVDNREGYVHLRAKGTTPGSALAVAWAAAESVVQHFRTRMEEDLQYLQDMLREESETLRTELQEAEAQWAKIVEEFGFDPVTRQKRLENEMITLQSDSDRLAGEQRELARRYRELVQARPLVEGSPQSLQATKVLAANGRVVALEKRILELKLRRDEQLERRTREHPEVVELEQRIAAMEERLPAIIKEELANSMVRFNDREVNEILYRSRKIALDQELKQEQVATLKRKAHEVAAQAVTLFPVKKTCDDLREKYRTVIAMANNVKFLGATNLFGQVRIVDPGRTAYKTPIRGTGVGPFTLTVILALLAALSAVYLLEYVDMKIKNEHDVTRYLNLPLLGVMPQVDQKELTQITGECSSVAERFNTAATLIRTTARELDLHTFAVCSAVAREGKTTVSLNLAAALARKGARVVLVDADMRMPQIHRILGLRNDFGLSTLLSGWVSPQQIIEGIMNEQAQEGRAVVAPEALQGTQIPGLRVLTSGPATQGAAKLIESDRFPQILRQLNETADFVIFDTPPIDRVGDALSVASLVDGCIFVVGSGQCEHHDVTWAKHLLTNVQANMLGAFLNRYAHRRTRDADYYSYGNKPKSKARA